LSGGGLRNWLLVFLFPYIKFALQAVIEERFDEVDEGLVIDLVESERPAKSYYGQGNKNGQKFRQENKQDDANTTSAGEIDELFEGQRAENLILDLDKLRHLETHIYSIANF